MQATFLLGPAGSGKTHRCLAEIRSELLKSPEGLPLVLLAPKQATFQLERQLLAEGALAGYTRLHILSFDRFAEFILEKLEKPPPKLLSEEGRVMVLRALLARKQKELKVFRATARLPGFAQQLSLLLRELQRHGQSPEKLFKLADRGNLRPQLGDKLHDLALLLRAYLDWLKDRRLQDINCLLDLAATALHTKSPAGQTRPAARFRALWLDGFAEMTPQELDFLAALAPRCERSTLAFCLDREPPRDLSWLSTWSVVGQTFRNCYQRLSSLPDYTVGVELVKRTAGRGRFAGNAVLAHLEEHWATPGPLENGPAACSNLRETLRVAICPGPEAEATLAAREILRHVRGGGRYRDCALLLRSLEGYHDVLQRVFRRYEIPFFLDRREPVAHHPLAELTRHALRTVAFGWAHDDWFGALKTGLGDVREDDLDELENEALARGWQGAAWKQPWQTANHEPLEDRLEHLRQTLVPPFQRLEKRLTPETPGRKSAATGTELADALRDFWSELGVEQTMEKWGATNPDPSATVSRRSAIHTTVWQEMQSWLDNLTLAFADEPLPLRDWLPILEAGLANLTVGVIPPALDEVLIGAVDRSRNPDLQLAIVAGLNESVFPAAPIVASLLTEGDRGELETEGVALGASKHAQLGHERYYGYIACTRARRRLVLTSAMRDVNDRALNPSPFLARLKRIFPSLETETYSPAQGWLDREHACEMIAPLLRARITGAGRRDTGWTALASSPALAPKGEQLQALATYAPDDSISVSLATQLYGAVLRTSASALEQFAACPFKFFVHSALRAEERRRFEVDARERGSFQHEVLKQFHNSLRDEGRQWRELTPAQARERIGQIAGRVAAGFGEGLFQASDQNAFEARSLTSALQDFIETAIEWMEQYGLDPYAVEVSFGDHDDPLPAWEIEIGRDQRMAFRGKIDRVDLAVIPASDEALCVVMDYKSGAKKIDALLLEHGIQIQLPAYLAALREIGGGSPVFGVARLVPAGIFYLNLRGSYKPGASRSDVLESGRDDRRQAYRHFGRFSLRALPVLDRRYQEGGSGQFNYRLTKEGQPYKGPAELLDETEFSALLDRTKCLMRGMGRRIFAGEAKVDPYRNGGEVACDFCDCRAICRIDPWTHRFRVLRRSPSETNEK
ncbi:MAG TPA: PD-(D/E)XK nuclease family protein [Candidatus Angelobacter sp.]|nr:PD-(D/E)XK nuclease family protein [Candidatus Angelobacter sp.]